MTQALNDVDTRARRLLASALLVGATSCAAPLEEPPPPPPALVVEHGVDVGNGNLLAVQAWVSAHDYASEGRLLARLDSLLDEAAARGLLSERTVVVLPEYVGAWLVAEGESRDTFSAQTTSDAMANVVLAHPLEWMHALFSSPAEDGVTHATFAAKAPRMAEVYQRVMGALAAKHGVTLVAGSILLPEPFVDDDGTIQTTAGGALQNASFVFGTGGALLGPPVVKSFLTADEQPFVVAGDPRELPVFDTPAGRLGVLVCADSWFPAAWQALDEKGAELVAVPVFVSQADVWNEPWQGYSGHDEPADVDSDDVGALSEGEAWRKYSLPARLLGTKARAGLTAPLRGALWDIGSDGQSLLSLPGGKASDAPVYDGPVLVSLWL